MKTVGGIQFLSVSEAKSILPKIVEHPWGATVLVRRSEPVAALVSIERYNDFLAMETLLRHPDMFDRLRALGQKARNAPTASLRTMNDLEAILRIRRESETGSADQSPADGR